MALLDDLKSGNLSTAVATAPQPASATEPRLPPEKAPVAAEPAKPAAAKPTPAAPGDAQAGIDKINETIRHTRETAKRAAQESQPKEYICSLKYPARPCETCGNEVFWIDPYREFRCGRCYPPIHRAQVRAWVAAVVVGEEVMWEPLPPVVPVFEGLKPEAAA